MNMKLLRILHHPHYIVFCSLCPSPMSIIELSQPTFTKRCPGLHFCLWAWALESSPHSSFWAKALLKQHVRGQPKILYRPDPVLSSYSIFSSLLSLSLAYWPTKPNVNHPHIPPVQSCPILLLLGWIIQISFFPLCLAWCQLQLIVPLLLLELDEIA